MAGKNWPAGGKVVIPAAALACLPGVVASPRHPLACSSHAPGTLGCDVDEFFSRMDDSEGFITALPDGRAILVKHRTLPGGGRVSLHDDYSAHRDLSSQLATTKKFLESVIDNVPVCVAAKSIEDGRYILANRAFERFSRLSR